MSNTAMENYYMVVPHFVMHDTTLSLTDRILYGILAGLSYKEGYTWKTNKYIAENLGVSTRTVQRSLRTLEEHNLIISVVTFETDKNRKKRFIYLRDMFITNGGDIEKGVYPFIDQKRYTINYLKPNTLNKRMRHLS